MKKILVPLLALIGISSYANNDNKVLFSEMQGNIYLDGKPAVGATVIRKYKWSHGDGNYVIDTYVTDKNGYFHFDAAYKGTWPLYLMTSPRINQEIKVTYNSKEYLIWYYTKTDEFRNSEIVARYDRVETGNGYALPKIKGVITIVCELNSEERFLFKDSEKDVFVTPPLGRCELVKKN